LTVNQVSFDSGGLTPSCSTFDSVAQLVELDTFNVEVIGSSPIRVTKFSDSSDGRALLCNMGFAAVQFRSNPQ